MGKVDIIYLNQLNVNPSKDIGLEIIKLIVSSEDQAKTQVDYLFNLAQTNVETETKQKDIIELVEKNISL